MPQLPKSNSTFLQPGFVRKNKIIKCSEHLIEERNCKTFDYKIFLSVGKKNLFMNVAVLLFVFAFCFIFSHLTSLCVGRIMTKN